MKRYYVALSGGLGDVLLALHRGAWRAIGESKHPVDIYLSSHNPHAKELFGMLPAHVQLRDMGWPSELTRKTDRGIPPERELLPLPPAAHGIDFAPTLEDLAALAGIEQHRAFHGWERVAVFAPGAGTPDRNIPGDITRTFVDAAIAAGWLPVIVGRTYEREGRFEPVILIEKDKGIHMKDGLTVPGVGKLVKLCGAVVSSHSAISMLAWLERKPNILVYPDSVRRDHLEHDDAYSFGMKHPETFGISFTCGEVGLHIAAARIFGE